jgi:peptidoglycan/LPS O-acetylase OafA/YrhL
MMRVFGLDIIRATAIILVLIGHLGHVGLMNNAYPMYQLGFFGVELFFVLSGFLIGQILIRDFQSSKFTCLTITKFWKNRWLRTLPLYYLVLIIRLLFDGDGHHLLHFIFLQNSHIVSGYNSNWFGESWSLCIEEYFYLTTPLIMFLLSKVFKQIKFAIIVALILIIVIAIISRFIITLNTLNPDFENDIRKFTFIRLDSLAIGIGIAFIKVFYPNVYYIIQHIIFAGVVFILFILLIFHGNILVYDFKGEKLIPSTLGLTMNSLMLAFLIPFADSIKHPFNIRILKIFNYFITKTSLFSYCMYLIHLPIYNLFIRAESINMHWIFQMILAIVFIYIISALSFYLFEKPILNLRNK